MEEKELFYYQKASQLLGLGMHTSAIEKEIIYFRAAKNTAGYKGYQRALKENGAALKCVEK